MINLVYYGEDSYRLGEKVGGREITMIGKICDNEAVGVFVGTPPQLYCEIPMTSVCRIYYFMD